MAGKKTGKRLLTWVLVLVMALSLLPLNVLAADGSETDSSSGMIFTKKLVSDTPDEKGNYTIQMTAQATGKEVETTKVKPMDIVLVLDQSGSMADDFNGKTTYKDEARRQYAMKEAVNSFIGEVAAKYSDDADHRMAIVTFDDNAKTLAGWTAVNSDGADVLTSEISDLPKEPEGATNVGAGMELAQTLMDNDAYTGDNTDRQKTVIVFTDGVPTTKTRFNVDVANKALEIAQNMKNDGVSIYTIGVFSGADIKQLYGKGCNGNVGDKWGETGFLWFGDVADVDRPAGNRFLNYLSSNFKNANKIGLEDASWDIILVHYDGWEITQNFKRTSSDYYMTASDASSLKNIFKVVSDTVPAPGDPALNKDTVITDTLSDYFTFATGTVDGDVKVYAGQRELTNGENITVNLNSTTKTVTVTGYDFSKHYQGIGGEDEETLVIEIKVKPDTSYTNWGASGEYKTNEGNATVTLPNNEEPIAEAESPKAHVNTYKVTYQPGEGSGDKYTDQYYLNGATTKVKASDTFTAPDGYEFDCWKDENNKSYQLDDEITFNKRDVVLTAQWKTKTDLSYTVNYLEQGTNEVLHKEKTTGNQTFGTEITSSKEVIDIDGYTYVSADPETLTIGTGENVINLYYTKRTDLSYTVNYVDKNTGSEIQSSVVKGDKTFGDKVTGESEKVTIANYTYVEAKPDLLIISTDVAKNVITLYYTKNAPTPGTFDFNDVDHSDDKATPAITKTVKGNVGKNFKETFAVTVKGADRESAATMSAPSYTGEAKVTYSDLTNIAFRFNENDKLTFCDRGTYTYTVWEVPGKTSRMSYDTTKYTLTINVVLDEGSNTYQVKSWQFTPGNREYTTALNIVNTYRTYHPSTPSKPTLNTGDHYAYVMGYPDGTVRPNGSITRAEVSAILFRLLSDETRDEYFTTESSFTDVKAGAWYNNSIATLEKAGVIVDTAKGGAFRPNEAITRAELAAMLAQFSDAKPVKGVKFSDVSAEHWAYEAIAIAAKMGWIEGYPDGTFRPDATITRAEMMTLVNRALERVPSDEDHLLSKRVMLTFPDCKSGDWFYIAVQEATNSHTYERAATEKNGDEQWTALRANRDWTQLEK